MSVKLQMNRCQDTICVSSLSKYMCCILSSILERWRGGFTIAGASVKQTKVYNEIKWLEAGIDNFGLEIRCTSLTTMIIRP